MKRKQLLPGIGASVGMLILILDGKTALEGAQSGIELCLRTVIPSLFPFFVLSILLTSSCAGASLPLLRPLGRLCGVPKGAESIFISGFLGGYPVGAQSISAAYHSGQLSKQDAERMLGFCNNAGPAFLFGMAASMFPRKGIAWVLWGIHILSALLAALTLPAGGSGSTKLRRQPKTSLSDALRSAVHVMATVCGWVVLFRVVIAFLKRWILWIFPAEVQVALTGLLELSNGCYELLSVNDVSLRFCICSGILAFGGLCVTMQTVSVTSGLSLRYYFGGKLMQTLFSLALCGGIVFGAWPFCTAAVLGSVIILRKTQKRCSIRQTVGV